MIFSKSITFDADEIGPAVASVHVPYAQISEESLFIEKLRSGDETAFETLVDRYTRDIFALLFRLTGNAEDAGDLTQETFIRVLRSVRHFRGESGIRTWLFRIAINESRNRFRWWKRRKRELTISLDGLAGGSSGRAVWETLRDDSTSPEDAALSREREQALRAALGSISESYREAVVLCDIEGLSYEETALATGVGIGTVKSRISRGREELRIRLKGF